MNKHLLRRLPSLSSLPKSQLVRAKLAMIEEPSDDAQGEILNSFLQFHARVNVEDEANVDHVQYAKT